LQQFGSVSSFLFVTFLEHNKVNFPRTYYFTCPVDGSILWQDNTSNYLKVGDVVNHPDYPNDKYIVDKIMESGTGIRKIFWVTTGLIKE
jgi:hypothetical protein